MLKVAQRLLASQRVVVSSYWKPPLLKEVGETGGGSGGGRNFQKLSHLGVLEFLPERGDDPENGGEGGRGW